MSGSTISVSIAGDASGLTKATNVATSDLGRISGATSASSATTLKESGKMFRGVGELSKGLGDAFGFPLDGIVSLSATMKDLSKGAAEVLAPAIDKISSKFGGAKVAEDELTASTDEAATAQEGLDAAEDANPLGAIITAVTVLAAGFIYLWQNSGTFRDIIKDIGSWIKNVGLKAFNDLWNGIQNIWNWVKKNWPLLLAMLTGPIGLAVLAIKDHWNTIKKDAQNLISALEGFFSGLGSGIGDGFKAVINDGIINPINDVINTYDHVVADHKLSPFPHINDIPTLATGGMFAGMALVGENGPELIQGGGNVLNAHQTAGMMGSPTVNIYATGPTLQDIVKVEINKTNRTTKMAAMAGSRRVTTA